ncbi:hypothetical protein CsSME_00007790 [Camellia sinensis var. sinensis]
MPRLWILLLNCMQSFMLLMGSFLRILSYFVSCKKHFVVAYSIAEVEYRAMAHATSEVVLDECLRAISGFKGTEDLFDDKLFDTPFTSDYTRIKKISSAPSYGSESLAVTKDEPEGYRLGSEQWSEAIEKHMPLVLRHSSAMAVKVISSTDFGHVPLSSSYAKEVSQLLVSSNSDSQDDIRMRRVNAALNDEVSSVRSAACRAIGVITCFPQIAQSAEILGKFIHAADINTRDPLVLVASHLIVLLIECSLRLTKDGDKAA